MSSFYTNVFMRSNNIYYRGYDKGIRVTEKIPYHPYLFVPKSDGKYKTLQGKPVDKIEFDSMSDARDFIIRYRDVTNMEIYGIYSWQYLWIFDTFKGEIDYDPQTIKVGNIDIECSSEGGFPDISRADKPLTAITVRCRGRNYVFGLREFASADPNTYYVECRDEYELVAKFLECWQVLDLILLQGGTLSSLTFRILLIALKFSLMKQKLRSYHHGECLTKKQ